MLTRSVTEEHIREDLSQDERPDRNNLGAEQITRREAGENDLIIRRGRILKQGSFRPYYK